MAGKSSKDEAPRHEEVELRCAWNGCDGVVKLKRPPSIAPGTVVANLCTACNRGVKLSYTTAKIWAVHLVGVGGGDDLWVAPKAK